LYTARKAVKRIYSGILAAFVAGSASGQVYKWTDADGRVHYGPRPPPAVKATALELRPSPRVTPESNVEIEVSAIQEYPVFGHTPQELHLSMMMNGPFNEIVQKRVYAEIHWRFRWKLDYVREPRKCRIGKFTVVLVTTITMPKWMNAQSAPPDMRALWPKVVRKIREHEDGHKAIGVEGANVLARRLSALPAYDTCEELGRVISAEGKRVYGEYALANRAFDRTEALKGSPFND
jgi:predicted secreted Zn-dependent protease